MRWKHPSKTKIYEALGSVSDERVEVNGNTGKVYSSSRNKYYDITYDQQKMQIMSNDNSSFYKATLGYPSIAFLMKKGVISYDHQIASILKGVAWKDINQKFKNNFEKALEYILSSKTLEERSILKEFVEKVDGELMTLKLGMLGARTKPPEGY